MSDVFPPIDEVWPDPPVDTAAARLKLAQAADRAPDEPLDEATITDLLAHGDGSEHWTISNDDDAEWCMRQLAEIDGRVGRAHRQADEYQARIDAWLRRATAFPNAERPWFVAQLTLYAWRRRAVTNGRVRTVRLPSGEIGTRAGAPPAVAITDPHVVLNWAREHRPELVKTTETVQVTQLRTVARVDQQGRVVVELPDPETGELVDQVVPGTVAEAGQPSATPKPYEID